MVHNKTGWGKIISRWKTVVAMEMSNDVDTFHKDWINHLVTKLATFAVLASKHDGQLLHEISI